MARLSQGDIYRNVTIVEGEYPDNLDQTLFAYSVLLSQDCDLQQDWDANLELMKLTSTDIKERRKLEDKLLRHLILAPCYVAEAFKDGIHIKERYMQTWNTKEMEKQIKANKHIRYHFLPSEPGLQEQNLVVDFKHYFSIQRDQFYELAKRRGKFEYVCSIAVLYREALSKRFGDYLSRIGFPNGDELMSSTKIFKEPGSDA
jgi:hypothetical protein